MSRFQHNAFVILKTLCLLVLVYYFLAALLLPVTSYDTHTYHLGRLVIAQEHGVFNHQYWTTTRQIVFPWTYDSLLYPFMFLGWGYALPSYFCLLGLFLIVRDLGTRVANGRVGWLMAACSLSMPTVLYQGVTTKNDLIIVFGLVAWLYFHLSWRKHGLNRDLFWGAIALGLTAGAKTTGLQYAFFATLFALWDIWQRASLTRAIKQGAMLLFSVLMLGSVETHIHTQLYYGHPLGPPGIRDVTNQEGWRGFSANMIRYGLQQLTLGYDAFAGDERGRKIGLEGLARTILDGTGLTDTGYRQGNTDATMRFLNSGNETSSDYGIIGTLAILSLFALPFALPRRWWWIPAVGVLAWLLTAYSVSWMLWNSRFFILSFVCFSTAMVLAVASLRHVRLRETMMSGLAVICLASMLIYPFFHAHKTDPRFLFWAIRERDLGETREKTKMREVGQRLRELAAFEGQYDLVLDAWADSYIFYFWSMMKHRLLIRTGITGYELKAMSETNEIPLYALFLEKEPPADLPVDSRLVAVWAIGARPASLYHIPGQ